MTRSHARNNTTQPNLTYYERSLLRSSSTAKRLGQDSFKPLDSCNLCLSRVTHPTCCPQGHIFCQECVISDLISQKAGIEGQRREMERWEDNERREREDARRGARERVVSDFERGMALGGRGGRIWLDEKVDGVESGGGFKFDGETVERVAKEAEEKALRSIEGEQVEARKSRLAAFWLPSLTPEAKLGPLKDVKLYTMCHVGGTAHPISRKTLLPVILTYPTPSSKPICPSCSRELSNATPSILLTSRSPLSTAADDQPKVKKAKKGKEKDELVCGHVVCKTCAETIVKPSGRCSVCEAGIGEGGMIPLGKEGTGFAAAGGAEVKKATIAFRI